MKTYRVIFSPEAGDQLAALYRYIATAASPGTAKRYVGAIVAHCEGLATFPLRGTPRSDIYPGLRIVSYKGRAVIAFQVETDQVVIAGVFYGGQDYETTLRDDLDESSR